MYLGIDIIPTKKGFYILEANLGVPGGITDIVEGTMHISPIFSKSLLVSRWIDFTTKSFTIINDLSKLYYNCNFSELVKNHKAMKDVKISKIARRQRKPIPENLSKWVYFSDKSYYSKFLKHNNSNNYLIPETYTALNKKELLKFGMVILEKDKEIIIKPARLWHGIGVTKINNIKKLIAFKPKEKYPLIVQEAISSDFLNEHFDMRLIIMCGHLLGVLIRVAVGSSIISNISAGGRVILCFPNSTKKGLIFKKITSKLYRRNYYTEWEKILLEDFYTFREEKYTVYDQRICYIGNREWSTLNKLAKEVYQRMVLYSKRSGVALSSKQGDNYLNNILNNRSSFNN